MAEEVRNIGYLAWKDPWAWMESMKGKRWENLIKQEKHNYHTLSSQRSVERVAKEMEKEMEDVSQYTNMPPITIGYGNISAIMYTESSCRWKWSWKKENTFAFDMDTQGEYVWYSRNVDDNSYLYEIICVDATGKEQWKKREVSPQIAVIGPLCYYIKMIDFFKTVELRVCNAYTGKGERILYRERDRERNIYVWKAVNKTLYFKSADPQTESISCGWTAITSALSKIGHANAVGKKHRGGRLCTCSIFASGEMDSDGSSYKHMEFSERRNTMGESLFRSCDYD